MSNRSLAAARNRRSPQEVVSNPAFKKEQQMPPQKMNPSQKMLPPQYQYQNQSQSQSSSSPSKNMQDSQKAPGTSGKLSVSDAIGLITIRLSKVEAHLMKESESQSQTTATKSSGGLSDVDTVLRSLVTRVAGLEKSYDTVDKDLNELNSTVKDLAENPVTFEVPSESVVAQPDPLLLERLEKTEKELLELKHLVIRLQTMFIETTMSSKYTPPPPPPTPTPVYAVGSSSNPVIVTNDDEESVIEGSLSLSI